MNITCRNDNIKRIGIGNISSAWAFSFLLKRKNSFCCVKAMYTFVHIYYKSKLFIKQGGIKGFEFNSLNQSHPDCGKVKQWIVFCQIQDL